MPQRVCLVGADTLLGQHMVQAFDEASDWKMSLWNPRGADSENNSNNCKRDSFRGDDELMAAVQDCDTVICLQDLQDMSASPNVRDMTRVNVEFVDRLKMCCEDAGVERFVLLSSYFVQCSRSWPNIYSRELDAKKHLNDAPFSEYVRTKVLAEDIVSNISSMQTLIVRTGPLYGEGDTKSVVCDAIKTLGMGQKVTFYSDKDGVIQMTYAGNVAYGVLEALKKMIKEPKSMHNEVLLVLDDTPIRNCSYLLKDLLGDSCADSSNELAFLPQYWMHCLLAFILSFLPSLGAQYPSPDWYMMFFYHWTFFSDFKATIFVDYKPRFSYDEAKCRSAKYYRSVSPDKIRCFSWEAPQDMC